MSAAIKIEISDAVTPDVIHRFRNFGESIHGALQGKCAVDLDEIDKATTNFVVRDIRKRDLGFVVRAIRRELRRHFFEDTATLPRL